MKLLLACPAAPDADYTPKGVLFVDNHQRRAVKKLHILLEGNVYRCHHLHLTAGDDSCPAGDRAFTCLAPASRPTSIPSDLKHRCRIIRVSAARHRGRCHPGSCHLLYTVGHRAGAARTPGPTPSPCTRGASSASTPYRSIFRRARACAPVGLGGKDCSLFFSWRVIERPSSWTWKVR